MAGGSSTRRQQDRDRPLIDRVGPAQQGQGEKERRADQQGRASDQQGHAGQQHHACDRPAHDGAGVSGPVRLSPRACWVRWSDEATPGHVLHWHREGTSWWALVLVTVPGSAVAPRSEDNGGGIRDQP